MKIEVDLDTIFAFEEDEPRSVQEAIRTEIIQNLTAKIQSGIGRQIEQQTGRILNDLIAKAAEDQMPAIVDDLMNTEYTPVSRYGSREEPTTFRKELLKTIVGKMEYKPTRYESDANVFTKAVNAVIHSKMAEMKLQFGKHVDTEFTKQALSYATEQLGERLGIKKPA